MALGRPQGACGASWDVYFLHGTMGFFFPAPKRDWIQILILALKRHGAHFSRLAVLPLTWKLVWRGL